MYLIKSIVLTIILLKLLFNKTVVTAFNFYAFIRTFFFSNLVLDVMLKLLFDDIKSLDFPSTEHKWSFYFLALPLGFTMGLQELEVSASGNSLDQSPFYSICFHSVMHTQWKMCLRHPAKLLRILNFIFFKLCLCGAVRHRDGVLILPVDELFKFVEVLLPMMYTNELPEWMLFDLFYLKI